MRQCFIARDGWVMVGVDSKGNQMRQLAARMEDKEFTDAVLYGTAEAKTDLHSLNQKLSGASSRSKAKNFFYGCILFGAGDAKTSKILGTSVGEAKEIKKQFLEQMPALQEVIEKLKREYHITAKRTPRYGGVSYYDGYIKGLDGRPILVPFEKDLLVYALQSDEAIQMGCAYVMIHKWAAEKGWVHGRDWGLLIWMHDEVQMECRPALADELGQLGCDAIRWAGEFYGIKCPHDGDYLVGQSWYNTH